MLNKTKKSLNLSSELFFKFKDNGELFGEILYLVSYLIRRISAWSVTEVTSSIANSQYAVL